MDARRRGEPADRLMRWIALTVLLGAAAPALAQPAAAPVAPDTGFLLDVRVGAGVPLAYPSARASALVPVTLGVGWRFRGGYRVAAVLEPSAGDLADLAYALDPSEPVESTCGAAGCGFRVVLGVEGARTLEAHPWRLWLGILVGLEGLDAGDEAQMESWFGPVARFTVGAPLMRVPWIELGWYASAELGVWTDHELETGGVTTPLAVGRAVHGAVLGGLRIALVP